MAKKRLLTRLKTLMATSSTALTASQKRNNSNFDDRVCPSSNIYKVGDHLFDKRDANSPVMSDQKLTKKVSDPLPIIKVSETKRYE